MSKKKEPQRLIRVGEAVNHQLNYLKNTMQLSIKIGDKEILEAIAEKYPNVMIGLDEIKHQLESRFADLLSFGDGDYDWRLGNDEYFKSLNELARDQQSDAEDAIAEGNIAQHEEDRERYLVSV